MSSKLDLEELRNTPIAVLGGGAVGNYGKFRIMLRNGLPPQVACARQPRPFA